MNIPSVREEYMVNHCDIGTALIAYKIFGNGPIDIVIEGSLNSCNAEWWDFCKEIENYSILVYDRAGYGKSSESSLARTPINIVEELHILLNRLSASNELILIGHSQGGLYVSLFAIKYPERVKKLILIDPLSFTDYRFKNELNEQDYRASGVDKTVSLKFGLIITKLRLGFLIKGLLKKAPPFYYHQFPKDAEAYILSSLIQKKQYKTALLEYELAHKKENLVDFKNGISKPIILITHSSKKMCEEIVYFGNTSNELANRIELLWQDIMEDMLKISNNNKKVIADNSSHYIHLTDEGLIIKYIKEIA